MAQFSSPERSNRNSLSDPMSHPTVSQRTPVKDENNAAAIPASETSLESTTARETIYLGRIRMLKLVKTDVILFSLYLTMFLAALDITIVATALPRITSQFEATAAQYTWVGSAYILASTSTAPLWARMSDISGRKPALIAANAAFLVGSLLAGTSTSIGMLIAGRTVQGFGSGGLLILITIVIADMFPLPERAKYYGLTGVIWAISSAMGPLLGGIFTESASWRWCFYINLPLDGISLLVLFFFFHVETASSPSFHCLRDFDWIGSVAVVGGTVCFLLGLESGASKQHSWNSAHTLGLLISGLLILTSCLVWEWKWAKEPLIPVKVLSGRSNLASLATAFGHSVTFISYDFYLPLYFQVVLEATPIFSGIYLLALIVPLSIMSYATGLYIRKTGNYRIAALLGCILMTTGTGLFIDFDTSTNYPKIVLYQLVAGIGGGPLFLSPMMALQSHLPVKDVAAGTSAFTFLRSLGTAISVVVGGVILQHALGGNNFTALHGHNDESITGEAYVAALQSLWVFYTGVSGAMLLASLLIVQRKKDHIQDDSQNSRKKSLLLKRTADTNVV